MPSDRPQSRLRCAHCGDVIGVYEPMVAMIDGVAHVTSKAMAGAEDRMLGDCYHSGCFERLHEGAG